MLIQDLADEIVRDSDSMTEDEDVICIHYTDDTILIINCKETTGMAKKALKCVKNKFLRIFEEEDQIHSGPN